MKTMHMMALVGAMLTTDCAVGAQTLNTDVGVPFSTAGNPGGTLIIIGAVGLEGQATLLANAEHFSSNSSIPSTFAGDLLLVNSTSGPTPSNAIADLRFFNPLDPNGRMGLPATYVQAFFANDVGAGGFAAFALLPNYNILPTDNSPGGEVFASETFFGPVGGIFAGQTAQIIFIARPAAVPEPGNVALLIGLATTGAGFLARRRRQTRVR